MRALGEIFLQIVGDPLKNELHFQEFASSPRCDFVALFKVKQVEVWAGAAVQVFAIPVSN